MPSFTGHISEAEIMKIIAYLKATSQEPPAR
jgi:cytochrome c2